MIYFERARWMMAERKCRPDLSERTYVVIYFTCLRCME